MVSSILELTTPHGTIEGKTQTRPVKFYNLDAIISVGYRVNSRQATLFRIWATERLKDYIIKGFTMDDERLKNPARIFGEDYFEEQRNASTCCDLEYQMQNVGPYDLKCDKTEPLTKLVF